METADELRKRILEDAITPDLDKMDNVTLALNLPLIEYSDNATGNEFLLGKLMVEFLKMMIIPQIISEIGAELPKIDCLDENEARYIKIYKMATHEQFRSIPTSPLQVILNGMAKTMSDTKNKKAKHFQKYFKDFFPGVYAKYKMTYLFAVDTKRNNLVGAIAQHTNVKSGYLTNSRIVSRAWTSKALCDNAEYYNFAQFSLLVSSASYKGGSACVYLSAEGPEVFVVWSSCHETTFVGYHLFFHSITGGCVCMRNANEIGNANAHVADDEDNENMITGTRKTRSMQLMMLNKHAKERVPASETEHAVNRVKELLRIASRDVDDLKDTDKVKKLKFMKTIFSGLDSNYKESLYGNAHLVFKDDVISSPSSSSSSSSHTMLSDFEYPGRDDPSWKYAPVGLKEFTIGLYTTLDDGCDLFVTCVSGDHNGRFIDEDIFNQGRNALLAERDMFIEKKLKSQHGKRRYTLWNCMQTMKPQSMNLLGVFREVRAFYEAHKERLFPETVFYPRVGVVVAIDFEGMITRCIQQALFNEMF